MLYTTFTVKDREYKARLNARACVDLEKRLGTNPINVFIKMMSGGKNNIILPPLSELLIILHASLQAYEHGITLDRVYEMYEDFIAEGKTMMDLVAITMNIYKDSGLIPEVDEEESEKNA